MNGSGLILALAGGVGGAKLALGLSRVLPPDRLRVVVNTADDFVHLGLHVSPDLDSVMYALAGMASTDRGWGIEGESWAFLDALGRLGGETWFQLGDRDLATHIERTRLLTQGEGLSVVTAHLCNRLGIAHEIAPMTDDPVRTVVRTEDGPLPFQDYFVRLRCAPVVTGFTFEGVEDARPSGAFAGALADGGLDAIVICPSNPFVSIDPILALPGVRKALARRRVPAMAVSPIVGGAAVKGPAAKMMRELGADVSPAGIAAHYDGLIDGLVIDEADRDAAPAVEQAGARPLVAQTLMRGDDDKARLAEAVLSFARSLSPT